MNFDDALKLLKEIIIGQIYHEDYERVVGLSRLYKILITGENHETLLQQFVTREDETLFNQRTRITQTITPPICDSLMKPFYKVGRAGGVIKKIEYDNLASDKKKAELKKYLLTFFGDENLEDYLNTRVTDLNFTDPNSFVLVDFKSFDPNVEKAKPYPLEISSEQAMNFKYLNNKLEWLVVKNKIQFLNKDGELEDGAQYFMYLDNDIIKLTQVDEETVVKGDDYILVGEEDDNIKFKIERFQPKGGQVQGVRVGYKRDLITQGRTFVNPFHAAVNYFMKMVKIVSELDLTTSLSAFPQKITYVDSIEEKDQTVDTVTYLANQKALSKSGTMGIVKELGESKDGFRALSRSTRNKKISTSSQETIELEFPKDAQDIVDLSKLVYYVTPPVEFLKWMQDFQNMLEEKVHRTVFNSNSFVKANFMATATEAIYDMDSVYDTLFPFASKYSSTWIFLVRITAIFTDNDEGLIVVHKFPSDFKFKTMGQLLGEMKAANDAGASSYIKDEINKDLAKTTFADDPEALKKNLTKEKFYPFKGKQKDEVLFILNNNKTTPYFAVLWANFDVIFDEIEIENENFYDLQQQEQAKIVKTKVAEFQQQIPAPAAAFSLRTDAAA